MLTLTFGNSYDLVLDFINTIGVRYCYEKEAQGIATREWILFHNKTICDLEKLKSLVLNERKKKKKLSYAKIVEKYKNSTLVKRSSFKWNLNTVHTWLKKSYETKKLIYPTSAMRPKEFFKSIQVGENGKLIPQKKMMMIPILKIVEKKPEFEHVYDVSTNSKNHTFIANGFITHNCWLLRDLRVPFGGVKDSGVGKEGGQYSLEFYSEDKNICIEL